MRLKCTVETVNLSAANQGFRGSHGKGIHSTLSVAKKAGGNVFLMWCTTKDKLGTKYKVKDNIENIFGKFVSEGKATVRLKEPNIDICISKANAIDLKRLMGAIKLAHTGDTLAGRGVLSSIGPVQNKVLAKPKTRLKVTNKKDYPLTAGFPSTLEVLIVTDCLLSRFDSRMLKLRHLKSLDLSQNRIKEIPEALAEMQCLVELNLENNEISRIPEFLCCKNSKLCKTLRSLKLSNNQIRYLPKDFGMLQELYQLHLNNNQLTRLPFSIGNLGNLKILLLSKNKMTALPYSIRKLSLDKLDVTSNEFITSGVSVDRDHLRTVPSLEELVAKSIVRNKVPYSGCDLTHFCIEYLEQGRPCACCTNNCFRSFASFTMNIDLRGICQMLTDIDTRWHWHAPVDAVLCSAKCIRKSGLRID